MGVRSVKGLCGSVLIIKQGTDSVVNYSLPCESSSDWISVFGTQNASKSFVRTML